MAYLFDSLLRSKTGSSFSKKQSYVCALEKERICEGIQITRIKMPLSLHKLQSSDKSMDHRLIELIEHNKYVSLGSKVLRTEVQGEGIGGVICQKTNEAQFKKLSQEPGITNSRHLETQGVPNDAPLK